jgi:DNA-binding response OmpR family regulator
VRTLLAERLDRCDDLTSIQVGTAAEGLKQAKLTKCDAVLLDVGLPDMDGRELCKLMRRQGVRAPVIMLTAADRDADIILGLESGANDYITKPLRIDVLLARLRSHLRQHERSEDAVMTIGPYEFHPAARILMQEGSKKKIRLTDKEASILKYLFRAGDRPVARQVLLNEVWGYNAGVTTHTLETHIYRLR